MSGLQVGGAVRPGAAYGVRPADEALPELLRSARLCYVLAPRQIGKSSLRIRSARRLEAAGCAVASVDLSAVGTVGLSAADWLLAIACEIADGLGWEDPSAAWGEAPGRSPVQRWLRALERGVAGSDRPTIIFLDEIDAVRALPFPGDDLFAAIRATVDLRASDPRWARLTFCLIGVAAPAELIRDSRRTPFNVGEAVALDDFTAEEAEAFLPSLAALGAGARPALEAAMDWTSGHPYALNQVLSALLSGPGGPDPGERVRQVVERLYFGPIADPALGAAARALLEAESSGAMLGLYRRIIEGEEVPVSEADPLQQSLRLTGLVAARRGVLVPRNRVVAALFDRAWVETQVGHRELRDRAWAWIHAGRPDGRLPTGAELAALQQWARGRRDLEREEAEFLLRAEGQSIARAGARRLRRALLGALAVALLALLAGAWALRAGAEAERLRAVRSLAGAVELARTPGQSGAALRQALDAYGALERTGLGRAALVDLADVMIAMRGMLVPGPGPGFSVAAGGSEVLLSGADGVWRLDADGRLLERLPGTQGARRLARSPDGALLLLTRADGGAALLEQSGEILGEYPPPGGGEALPPGLAYTTGDVGGGPDVVGFSPSGAWAAWIGAEGTLSAIDRAGGAARQVAAGAVRARFAGEDRLLVAHTDGTLSLRARSGEVLARYGPWADPTLRGVDVGGEPKFPASLLSLASSPDGRRVVVVGRQAVAVVVDLEGGEVLRLPHPPGAILGVVWTPGGIVTAGEYGEMWFWDPGSGQLRLMQQAHTQSLVAMTPAPDGRTLATGGHDDSVRLWDLHTGALLWTATVHAGIIGDLAFSPTGEWLWSISRDGRAARFAPHSALALRAWRGGPGNPSGMSAGQEVLGVAWTDAPLQLLPLREGGDAPWSALRGLPAEDIHLSGEAALVSATDGLRLLRRGGALLGPLPGRTMTSFNPWIPGGGWLSRDTRGRVHAYHADGTLWFSAALGQVRHSEPALSPDGRRLVVSGEDHGLSVYDIATGTSRVIGHHTEPVDRAVWSPDGRALASVSTDNTLRVWEADTGELRFLRDIGGNGLMVLWRPEPPELVVGVRNGRLSLWSERGEPSGELTGHRGALRSVALSPDGRRLVSASEDGELRLWSLEEGELLARFSAHRGVARLARFSPDGRWLYSAGDDGMVLQFPGDSSEIVAMACAWLARLAPEAPAPRRCASGA